MSPLSPTATIDARPANAGGAGIIYVDVATLSEPFLTGIGRYVMRMVEQMSRRADVRAFTTLASQPVQAAGRAPIPLWGEEIVIPRCFGERGDDDVAARSQELLRQPRRPWNAAEVREAAALYPILRPPHRFFRTEIGVLHDFTPVITPAWHAPDTITHFGAYFSQSAALHDWIIAVSRSTKWDARTMCALANERIRVAYNGPSMCVERHCSSEPVTRANNIILAVSTLEPRKNGPFLMDWFVKTKVLPPRMELWWVGGRGWWADDAHMADIEKRLRDAGDRRVKLTGIVSDAQLCALYRQAAFTIYPSFYEGFGFPVLDSLLHGAPVACGYNSSLQEFDCPGVHYFDATDADTLDGAVRELMAQRPEAIDIPALRERFSWEKAADEVLRLAGIQRG